MTARPIPEHDPLELPVDPLVQRFRRAIAIFDAQADLLRQGWVSESVLATTWTVEFQSDGSCTAELVPEVKRRHPGSSVTTSGEAGHTADASQSTFKIRGAAEGLKVDVYLSREALALLGSGKEVLLTPPPTEGKEIEVAEVRVRPMLE